jgi:hypothetical protein
VTARSDKSEGGQQTAAKKRDRLDRLDRLDAFKQQKDMQLRIEN